MKVPLKTLVTDKPCSLMARLMTALTDEKTRFTDDEPRWLIALISDTGMRLSEPAACSCDIHLDGDTPYIDLVEHPWRRLKTSSSSRQVPLVGASLWAAHRILETGSTLAFPKYCGEAKCNANSASAALNKWLKPRVPDGCVIHSFRHSLRDRLRVIECPADIIDAIGGWVTEGIGHQYGKGHSLTSCWVDEEALLISVSKPLTSYKIPISTCGTISEFLGY